MIRVFLTVRLLLLGGVGRPPMHRRVKNALSEPLKLIVRGEYIR